MRATLSTTEHYYKGELVEAARLVGDARHQSITLKWVRSLGAPYSKLTSAGMVIIHPEGMKSRVRFGDYIIRNYGRFYAVSSEMFEEHSTPATKNRKKAS